MGFPLEYQGEEQEPQVDNPSILEDESTRVQHAWDHWEGPPAAGLYDPTNEKDACGVGFIVSIDGVRSHKVSSQFLLGFNSLRNDCGLNHDHGPGALLMKAQGVYPTQPGESHAQGMLNSLVCIVRCHLGVDGGDPLSCGIKLRTFMNNSRGESISIKVNQSRKESF